MAHKLKVKIYHRIEILDNSNKYTHELNRKWLRLERANNRQAVMDLFNEFSFDLEKHWKIALEQKFDSGSNLEEIYRATQNVDRKSQMKCRSTMSTDIIEITDSSKKTDRFLVTKYGFVDLDYIFSFRKKDRKKWEITFCVTIDDSIILEQESEPTSEEMLAAIGKKHPIHTDVCDWMALEVE